MNCRDFAIFALRLCRVCFEALLVTKGPLLTAIVPFSAYTARYPWLFGLLLCVLWGLCLVFRLLLASLLRFS